jgi:hypothetical protein
MSEEVRFGTENTVYVYLQVFPKLLRKLVNAAYESIAETWIALIVGKRIESSFLN